MDGNRQAPAGGTANAQAGGDRLLREQDTLPLTLAGADPAEVAKGRGWGSRSSPSSWRRRRGWEQLQIIDLKVEEVQFIKELYPRLKENQATIDQYREALDNLPPINTARGNVLVDGYHRWQAHKRENRETINAIDLGNLTDIQIIKESLQRNASHGYQLTVEDKKRNAERLYRMLDGGKDERYEQIAGLLSVDKETARKYCQKAQQEEKAEQQDRAWDLWLDCWTQDAIAEEIGVDQKTVSNWVGIMGRNPVFPKPPGATPDNEWGNVQHFDVWSFATAANEGGYFGKLSSQVVENILWLFTEPGNTVFDPFAGSGTVIDVAKKMGRRIWASDRKPASAILPIHQHDIVTGWPEDAPSKVSLIILDPPYWIQAKEKYSTDPEDLANMSLDGFVDAWKKVLDACSSHIADNGYLCFIVSPAEDKEQNRVVDLAYLMYEAAIRAGLRNHRRIIATYNTQQANGQQVTWARENKWLLKLYRDLVVMKK